MGVLGRFSSKREEKVVEKKIQLKDVETFAENKIKKDFNLIKPSLKEEYNNLQQVSKTMLNQLKALEQASYPERTYQILIDKAVGNR
jgi:hypothetical protein